MATEKSLPRRKFLAGAAGVVAGGAAAAMVGDSALRPGRAAASDPTIIFGDFESADLATSAQINNTVADRVRSATVVASHGGRSLEYDVAAHDPRTAANTPQITLFAGKNFTKIPWSGHEIITWDVMSDSPVQVLGQVTFKDSKGHAFGHGIFVPAIGLHSYDGLVSALSGAGVDVDDIVEIDISLPRQPWPVRMFLDTFRLVDANPYDHTPYIDAAAPGLINLMGLTSNLQQAQKTLHGLENQIPHTNSPADRALREQAAALATTLTTLGQQAGQSNLDLTTAQGIYAQVQTANGQIERFGNVVTVRRANPTKPDYGLAAADSMVLVFPKDRPAALSTKPPVLEMARGEYQSAQAVVIPYAADLSGVTSRVRAVTDPNGRSVEASLFTATVNPVGFLNTTPNASYKNSNERAGWYTGWTPDPIRDDLRSIDVAAADFQPFWINAYAAPNAPAGRYQIEIEIAAANASTQRLTFPVQVWPFALADRPVLTTSFNYEIELIAPLYGVTDPDATTKLSHQYEDFLETYKIEPGNVYTSTPPTVAELQYLQNKWGLRHFNIVYLNYTLININDPSSWQAQIDSWVTTISDAMAEYQKVGLDKYAYVYGFDERPASWYPVIKQTLTAIKAKFPDLPVISTLRDNSMGVTSGLTGLVDVWAPEQDLYNQTTADGAHARGDQVYWYPDIGTGHPFPNWFNGYPPIDARMLMGPMSYQAKVDGVLYYQTTRWVGGQTILDDDLFSNWNDLTGPAPGDGSLLYPGPDGPMASMRLSNVRDGMQDYNLLDLLAQRIANPPPHVPAAKLAAAKALLGATDVVQGDQSYTEDPQTYRSWRSRVAAAISDLG